MLTRVVHEFPTRGRHGSQLRVSIGGAGRIATTMTAHFPPIRSQVVFLFIVLLFTCCGVTLSQENSTQSNMAATTSMSTTQPSPSAIIASTQSRQDHVSTTNVTFTLHDNNTNNNSRSNKASAAGSQQPSTDRSSNQFTGTPTSTSHTLSQGSTAIGRQVSILNDAQTPTTMIADTTPIQSFAQLTVPSTGNTTTPAPMAPAVPTAPTVVAPGIVPPGAQTSTSAAHTSPPVSSTNGHTVKETSSNMLDVTTYPVRPTHYSPYMIIEIDKTIPQTERGTGTGATGTTTKVQAKFAKTTRRPMTKITMTTARHIINTHRRVPPTTAYAGGGLLLSEASMKTSKLSPKSTKHRTTDGRAATIIPTRKVKTTTAMPLQSQMITEHVRIATTYSPIGNLPGGKAARLTTKPAMLGHVTTHFRGKTYPRTMTSRFFPAWSSHGPVIATTQPKPFSPILSTVAPELPKDLTYNFKFQGACSIVLGDIAIRGKFEICLKETITKKLYVPQDNILFLDIYCGSVNVVVKLHDIQESKVAKLLAEFETTDMTLSFTVEGQTYVFPPLKISVVNTSSQNASKPPEIAPVRPTAEPNDLRYVDMIIIIVVSVVGGMLIIIIITLIIHECRRRSHAKSFDLRGTPQEQVNTEDFTLTKMERGPAEYNEYGFIVNGQSRAPQVGIATIVESPTHHTTHHNGDVTFTRYHDVDKGRCYEPEFDGGPDSPSISLMKSMRTPQSVGIENPSFSSEDLLDSGTETDRDNVCSDKGVEESPEHTTMSMEHVVECDSGRQSDSPLEICTADQPPSPQSPRSSVADDTGSSDNASPHSRQSTPVMDLPKSHSQEVLMPSEELSYPSEDVVAVVSGEKASPCLPANTLSYSPDVDSNAYEMLETKRSGSPGSRESELFAVTEGATAF